MSDYEKEFEEEKKYGYSGSALDHYGEYILWFKARLQKSEEREKIYREYIGHKSHCASQTCSALIKCTCGLNEALKKAGEIK